MAPSGQLRFFSVMGTNEFHAADVTSIVWFVKQKDRKPVEVTIKHGRGSVTLDVDSGGEIVDRLRKLQPTVPVSNAIWDDVD